MGNGALPHGPSYRAHPRLYHRVELLRCEGSDAIGAKRTCRERRKWVDLTKMTHSRSPCCIAQAMGHLTDDSSMRWLEISA